MRGNHFLVIFTFILFFFQDIYSQNCEKIIVTKPGKQVFATAGFLANIRDKPNSIKVRSKKIFNQNSFKNIHIDCPKNCKVGLTEMIFSTIPSKFKTSYSDKTKCEKYLKKTSKQPIVYKKKFKTMEKLHKWYSEFSRGKEKEGEDLYKKCDGECSPSYKLFTKEMNGEYDVRVEVICGHARDKSDNMYKLKTTLRRQCLSK